MLVSAGSPFAKYLMVVISVPLLDPVVITGNINVVLVINNDCISFVFTIAIAVIVIYPQGNTVLVIFDCAVIVPVVSPVLNPVT